VSVQKQFIPKIPIHLASEQEISALINFDKPFRIAQLQDWIFKKKITDFSEITNIPVKHIDNLKSAFLFPQLRIEKITGNLCRDAAKVLFKTKDETCFESALIPNTKSQYTACVSSQVGCPLSCAFCASGMNGFSRNLHADEIVEQYVFLSKICGNAVSNIVFMGMGEPMFNYSNIIAAAGVLTSKDKFGLAPSRISISTAGIPQAIEDFAQSGLKYNLLVSLHSARQATRNSIMPGVSQRTLEMLKSSIQYYTSETGLPVTVEYIMLKGINDTEDEELALRAYLKNMNVKINIIAYNRVNGLNFDSSEPHKIKRFISSLKKDGHIVVQRFKRGTGFGAGCGQLAWYNKLTGAGT